MLSWRVLILPGLEDRQLFERFDLNEPWDSLRNRTVSSSGFDWYRSISNSYGDENTNYVAVVGPETAWPTKGFWTVEKISEGDGITRTILLMEAGDRDIHWTEPRDLNFDEAVNLLSRQPSEGDGHVVENGFFYRTSLGRNISFANGQVVFLHRPLARELAAALLTVDGGETIDERELQRAMEPQLDYAKCFAFGLFVALAFLPAVRLMRRGKTDTGTAEEEQCGAG